VLSRPPLIILAGDVGSGKTELAETISDMVATANKIDITLFPLTLGTRGRGLVGDMTQLLSSAFDRVTEEAKRLINGGRANGAIVLLIDEADALAQSRESAQMHHEDKAGVNVLIRGIDQLASQRLPVATIMCTNRIGSLDPAVRRRAAEVMLFGRPSLEQRLLVLRSAFGVAEFSEQGLKRIAEATGAGDGYTFSDLTQRYIPAVVLDAFPGGGPIEERRALALVASVLPTPPFVETTS
jgi:AAA+ superfamily predicted ATPase